MNNEETAVVDASNNEGEGQNQEDTISLSRSEFEKMNQTLGSLKRELKDLRKPKEDSVKETPQQTNKADDSKLVERLEKMALRQEGIEHPDDIELARNTAKKWGMDVDEVLADEDFKVKLQRQQDARANTLATSGVKGGAGSSQAKNTPEYWVAKGVPPTTTDVPDRKIRAKIARAMMDSSKNSKKFYND